ncbi:hypothetical protein PISMIDRAFT_687375 [Pisolithus microcarpus 441]|uniref:Uncharacterized protein n=1 Tax=Pisolithus microcarpus 441 TaxID=765257 RepID=A0A0C9YYT4_9AGAM|nr:hypothetical protein PISMIDRAFT_687375 [Pisolithus microcarpus 441]
MYLACVRQVDHLVAMETILDNRRSKKVIMESSKQRGRLVPQVEIKGTETSSVETI